MLPRSHRGRYIEQMLRSVSMVSFTLMLLFSLSGQDSADKEKDKAETLVIKPERTIEFSTDEGTWMSVDVSPGGQTLLVDLLGDLYTLPAAGGERVVPDRRQFWVLGGLGQPSFGREDAGLRGRGAGGAAVVVGWL
jgi:hypothetical protein